MPEEKQAKMNTPTPAVEQQQRQQPTAAGTIAVCVSSHWQRKPRTMSVIDSSFSLFSVLFFFFFAFSCADYLVCGRGCLVY